LGVSGIQVGYERAGVDQPDVQERQFLSRNRTRQGSSFRSIVTVPLR